MEERPLLFSFIFGHWAFLSLLWSIVCLSTSNWFSALLLLFHLCTLCRPQYSYPQLFMAKSKRVVVGNLGGVLCTVFTVQMVTRLLILPLTSKLYRHRGSCSLTLSLYLWKQNRNFWRKLCGNVIPAEVCQNQGTYKSRRRRCSVSQHDTLV